MCFIVTWPNRISQFHNQGDQLASGTHHAPPIEHLISRERPQPSHRPDTRVMVLALGFVKLQP